MPRNKVTKKAPKYPIFNNLGSHILGSLDIKLSHHQFQDKESTDRPVITPKILKSEAI